MLDELSFLFIKIDPYFDTITEDFRIFRRNEAEAIHTFAMLKTFTDEEVAKFMVYFSFVGLGFGYLENKATAFFILLILPLRFDAFPEIFDRVDFLHGAVDGVSK